MSTETPDTVPTLIKSLAVEEWTIIAWPPGTKQYI
jgi:hypothetical protein